MRKESEDALHVAPHVVSFHFATNAIKMQSSSESSPSSSPELDDEGDMAREERLAALRDVVLDILKHRYDGSQTSLAADVSLSEATLSRTLNVSFDYTDRTRERNLKTILVDLRRSGHISASDLPNFIRNAIEIEHEAVNLSGLSLDAEAGALKLRVALAPPLGDQENRKAEAYYLDAQEALRMASMFAVESEATGPALTERDLYVTRVVGDSMEPEFVSGDYVVVARAAEGTAHVPTDGVYHFRLADAVHIKRLQRRAEAGVFRVKSTNPAYDSYDVRLEGRDDFEVFGRVAGKFKRY